MIVSAVATGILTLGYAVPALAQDDNDHAVTTVHTQVAYGARRYRY